MAEVAASLQALAEMFATEAQYVTKAVKFDQDFDRYSAVLERVRPDIIVEVGTWRGYSSLWFAEHAKPGCVVVTIDITNNVINSDVQRRMNEKKILRLGGSSLNPQNIRVVEALTRGRTALFSLDGDHCADTVFKELCAYGPMVTKGSYIVVEDGLLRYLDDPGRTTVIGNPLDAIEKFLEYNKTFVVDKEIEDMSPVTQHISGWLRRV